MAKKIKVCIDAGHFGKYNQSPVNKAYYESEMSWKLHKLLKSALEAYGITVTVTRAKQTVDRELYARGAASKGCDLFLSIHSNAAGTETPDYAVACCQVCGGISVDLGKKLASVVNKTMGSKGKYVIWQRKGNGGLDYYGVLRGAKAVGVPGILLEHGFHTNKKNTAFLLEESNLKKLAEAEAKVIADYFGVKAPSKQTSTQTAQKSSQSGFKSYTVKVICNELNVRKTPKWSTGDVVMTVKKGEVYTIVAETVLDGTKFGKLKSGAGWISLGDKYIKKV